MTTVQTNVDLKDKNTMRLPAKAQYYAEFKTAEDLREILLDPTYAKMPRFVLGGGSNTIFTQDFEGLVLHSTHKSINVIEQDDDTVLLRVGAGKSWCDFVRLMIKHHWCGLENLSGIPGTIGGAVVGNIGAYGVEVEDRLISVSCYDPEHDTVFELSCKDCEYAYRTSIFKTKKAKNWIVLSATFLLFKNFVPRLKYKGLAERIRPLSPVEISPELIAHEVLALRRGKLPGLRCLGSVGSFFKNPILSRMSGRRFLARNPDACAHRMTSGRLKVSAAWLIDQSRLKNKSAGDACVYRRQPLVLVNTGNATGKEIMEVARLVQMGVKKRFNIILEPEPVIL